MARKGRRNIYRKQDAARVRKTAVAKATLEPTEPSAERVPMDSYTSARSTSVPSEKLAGEIVIEFLQKWSHWIVWVTFLAAGIFAYADFNNDISNAKSDVIELHSYSRDSREKILSVEKSALSNQINIEHLSTTIDGIRTEVDQTQLDLKRVEVMQAKQSVTDTDSKARTKSSSKQSR